MVAQLVNNLPANAGVASDMGLIPGLGISPEGENTTCSGMLAWRIPQTKEPGTLQSPGHKELDITEHIHMHAGNTGVHVLLKLCLVVFLFFLYICPGVRLLDHMVALVLVLKESSFCSRQWLYQFTFPQEKRDFPLLNTLSSIYCLQTFR